MAGESACWGIELGQSSIKAVKLGAAADGGVEVLDFVVIPHKKVLSTPDIDIDDALRVAVGQLASQYDLTGAPIAVSVPGNQSFSRFAKLPPVEPKKVGGLVKFEATQQIPFGLDEVEWDYQTFMSPDSPEVEVGIFAITKERIDKELTLLRDVGLNPDTITVAPVASYNAMAYDLQFTESTPGTVIMDVGTTSTDLIVAEQGSVWIRTFPIGGHHFTEALVEKFKLSYGKAERLKREAERSKHARHVFQAMKGVFADLAQETQRSIGYHKSLHPESDLRRVIGIGSTFKLPGLRRFLKQQLQLDVYRIDEFKRLTLDGPRAGEFGAVSIEMPVAYGLALQGLGYQTIDANLMPVSLVREGVWQKKTKWFGIAAALGLTASAAMFIRFAIDNNAVTQSQAPTIINTASSRAGALQNEANDAGVAGSAAADPDAQALLQLDVGREIYPHVVNDLGLMLASANATASDGIGFELVSFQTGFLDAATAAATKTANAGGGRFEQVEEPEDPYPEADKIDIGLVIETDEPQPERFLLNTVRLWLLDNADREGVPYVIQASERLDYGPAGSSSARGGGERPTRRPSRGDRGGGSQFTGGHGGGGGDVVTGGGELAGGDDMIGGGERRQPGGSRGGFGGSSGNLESVAPIPDRPEADEQRQTTSYIVRYRLALVPESERVRPEASG
ncbi:MAG: pilus assembly protein PilM, partial [Planctomycetota bacterium]